LDQGGWNMKIEMASQRGTTTVRLSGDFRAEHIEELTKQCQDNGPQSVLDLKEVTVVDVEVVRFLGACEANGAKIVHCPRYIREWMNRERKP
jgi:anti-anti-sigma regulatory factor